MKAQFQKRIPKWKVWTYLGILGALVLLCSITRNHYFYLILWLPMLATLLRSYQISDDDILSGNGRISVRLVRKIKRYPNRVDVFYTEQDQGEINTKSYYTRDLDAFISVLKKINPMIQIEKD